MTGRKARISHGAVKAPAWSTRPDRRKWEDLFEFHLKAAKVPGWIREHRFHTERRWRFDFAWPSRKIGVEIEGLSSVGKGGRHQRISGYRKDLEKYNAAVLAGWRVLRFTSDQVSKGEALAQLLELMEIPHSDTIEIPR